MHIYVYITSSSTYLFMSCLFVYLSLFFLIYLSFYVYTCIYGCGSNGEHPNKDYAGHLSDVHQNTGSWPAAKYFTIVDSPNIFPLYCPTFLQQWLLCSIKSRKMITVNDKQQHNIILTIFAVLDYDKQLDVSWMPTMCGSQVQVEAFRSRHGRGVARSKGWLLEWLFWA